MRDIPENLQSHIDSGATTLCHIWTLTRKDGAVFGFTDHDDNLVVDGVNYIARSGMSGGDVDSSLGFSIDNGHVESVLSDARITADDINAGLYERAELSCAVVNWQDTSQRMGLNADNFPSGTVCPRSFSACRDRFNNALNFRGFPYLLGDDALTAAPRESEIRDGGSRYEGRV